MDNDIVIIGGGIAGIFSALLFSKKGCNVTLVEKESEIGGLLRSQELFEKGLFFDYGTHLLGETGVAAIDKLLFSHLDLDTFDYLKVGSYYDDLFEGNGFVCDRNIENRSEYLEDLTKAKVKDTYDNLGDQLESEFGKGYASKLLKPIVEKFFFTPPSELVPDSHALFGLSRIIVSNSEDTKILKKEDRFDKVLAYHSYKDGASSRKSMYPKSGGVGSWIKSMKNTLLENNVKIVTNAEIGSIVTNQARVSSIEVNDNTLPVSRLIWTIPPFFLLSKVGVPSNSKPPKRLTSCIFHYLIDEQYLTDLYYFQCFDPDLKSFRVTLYDNYSMGISEKYRVSVEVLLESQPNNIAHLQNEIFEELKTMKVFSDNASIINQANNIYPNGFPVLTSTFVTSAREQYEAVTSALSNVDIYGKANGRTWFMNDILSDIYSSTK